MVNRVLLIGNVGNAYPLRQVGQYNTACLNFSVATEYWKKKKDQDPVKETTWHNVTVWGQKAERMAAKIQKGTKIHVTGRMEYGSYMDKKTNQEVKTANVICEEAHILAGGIPKQAAAPAAPEPQYAPPPQPVAPPVAPAPAAAAMYADDDDGDLPF